MKKFELTSEFITFCGIKLFRIKALVEFGNVKAGDFGGYIENEDNLNHDGNAWVYDNARVYGDAEVCGNAWVYDNARVYGDAEVYGDARVCGNAWVYDNARVYGDARVCGDADYTTIRGFGTYFRNTTFFRCKNGEVRVVCGCFFWNNCRI